MKKRYDFSKAKKNPYARRPKKQITIRIDEPTIEYFRSLSEATGIRYQTLINLYLRDCAVQRRKLAMEWGVGVIVRTAGVAAVASSRHH
jgi:uncharacterized protein (DUF4415 family)